MVSATPLASCGGGLCSLLKRIARSTKPRGCQSCLVQRHPVCATLRILMQWPKWLLMQVHDHQGWKQLWQEAALITSKERCGCLSHSVKLWTFKEDPGTIWTSTVPGWDCLDQNSPSLKIQPVCGALSRRSLSRRGTHALLANTASTGTGKADERSQKPQGQDCNQTLWQGSNGNIVAAETKRLHWLLARSTLAPYALAPHTLALASCLCGSPSVDTSLQQLQFSLLGHSCS